MLSAMLRKVGGIALLLLGLVVAGSLAGSVWLSLMFHAALPVLTWALMGCTIVAGLVTAVVGVKVLRSRPNA